MFACLVSLFEDAKKWIPVSCWMIGKAINWRYDYRQHSRKRPGCNYYSEKYSHSWLIQHEQVYIQNSRIRTKRWSEYESNWWNHTQNLFPMGSRSRFNLPLIAAWSEHSIETIVYFSRWSYHTLTFIYLRGLHDATWLNFVKIVELPDKDAISISSKIVEGYESYPRGPESAGVGGILNICTCH